MKKVVGVVILMLAGIGLLPYSAPAAAPDRPAAPQKTGEIRGALAYCGPGGNNGIGIFIPGRSYQATLGPNGQFVFNFVPPGTYNLTVEVPGHAGEVIPNVVVADNTITDLGSIAICRDSDGDSVNEATDCNDNNSLVNPNATEVCDGIDNNCNSQVDEGCVLCTDADHDGFYAQAGCLTQRDCNDGSAAVRPNASELCDTVDNNCNALVDEGFDLTADLSNCGACGNVCSFANAGASCSAGSCHLGACSSGFADCDGLAPGGCETNVSTDINNCGACGNVCSLAQNASATSCSGGSCQVAGCLSGYGDCNGQAPDGCETYFPNSNNNCGSCGHVCGSVPYQYQCGTQQCNPYQCNPYQCNPYSCGPLGLNTCYQTCYQTCYNSCPTYCTGYRQTFCSSGVCS